MPNQVRGFGQAASAHQAAGKAAPIWFDKMDAAPLQCLTVGLHCGTFVHTAIHRWRNHQRAPARQRRDRQQIVCQSMRQLRHRVGGGRGDNQYIRLFCQANVRNMACQFTAGFAAPHIGVDRASGDSLKGKRTDEALSRLGQHDIDHGVSLRQLAGEINRFVGSDAAADTENDAFVLQKRDGRHAIPSFILRLNGTQSAAETKVRG